MFCTFSKSVAALNHGQNWGRNSFLFTIPLGREAGDGQGAHNWGFAPRVWKSSSWYIRTRGKEVSTHHRIMRTSQRRRAAYDKYRSSADMEAINGSKLEWWSVSLWALGVQQKLAL